MVVLARPLHGGDAGGTGGRVQVVEPSDVELEALHGLETLVLPAETKHGDGTVGVGDRQHVGDGAHADRNDSALCDEVRV